MTNNIKYPDDPNEIYDFFKYSIMEDHEIDDKTFREKSEPFVEFAKSIIENKEPGIDTTPWIEAILKIARLVGIEPSNGLRNVESMIAVSFDQSNGDIENFLIILGRRLPPMG